MSDRSCSWQLAASSAVLRFAGGTISYRLSSLPAWLALGDLPDSFSYVRFKIWQIMNLTSDVLGAIMHYL